MNWIKCSDKMPDHDEVLAVVVFDSGRRMTCAAYWVDYQNCWNWDGERIPVEHVTHWQPLPEPPND